MANFQVKDGYGSIITIQSSTFGSAERQIVGASIIGTISATLTGNPSISGTVNVGNIIQASVHGAVSVAGGTIGTTQVGAWAQSVVSIIAPTSSVMSLATAASTTTALAANTARRGAMISNNSATSIMVKLGAMATSSDFTLLMQNTDYYEIPFNYSGRIDYFASSVAGVIKVTEIT